MIRSSKVIAILLCSPLAALAADQKLAAAQVPEVVKTAVTTRYATAKQLGWSKEVEHGKTEFEAKLDNGLEVTVSPEGKILSEESPIAFEQVPEAARQAFAASKYGKWKIRKAEKIVEGDKTQYEIAAHEGKAGVEVVIDEQGKIIHEEKTPARGD